MKKRMSSSPPRIGFDRFIRAEWADCAFNIRRGIADSSDLERLLNRANLGAAARTKTMTVLKKLWLCPAPDLEELTTRSAAAAEDIDTLTPFHWVMAVSSYPFFGKVAEIFGKLTAIQGDCASSELHRRMSEIYGEREGTYRMTNMVLQTQANWGALRRSGKRLERCNQMHVSESEIAALLAEAAVRYHGKPLSTSTLFAMPILYPFKVTARAAQMTSRSSTLEMRPNSRGEPMVAVRN